MATKFILVTSISPYHSGGFSRAGLRFERNAWRPLELADADDLPNGKVGPETEARLRAETTMLVVKDASPEDVEQILKQQAEGPKSKDVELAELRAKNADLEARLMRLEMAATGAGASGKPPKPDKAKDEQPKG